jgi:hypothetical protein
MQNVTIYRQPGRYAGWPANYGIWNWGNEIVVGYTLGYMEISDSFHPRDKSRPFLPMQARSLDGGLSWEIAETPCKRPGGRGLSADEHMIAALHVEGALAEESAPTDCPGGINFTHPDFALMCARSGLQAGAVSWFYISYDRCQSWQGPYKLPMFGQLGIAARTDYVVRSANDVHSESECTIFLTATKSNGQEGRVFCARTTNAGRSFQFRSWVGAEPEGYAIMPASVRLPNGRWLTAIRCAQSVPGSVASRCWIDLYASDDDAASWQYLGQPVPNTGKGGNPPTLTRLQDGRLCLTYGFRDAPFGIRARLSENNGRSWEREIILRRDGGNHDLGYPRTVQRADGMMVTAYYYNDRADGERYIAATIWTP